MKSILLVDDDFISIFVARKTLERMNLTEIHSAVNGDEAITLLKDNFHETRTLPDVILLDLNMPIMDGFSFIDAFRKLDLPTKEKVKIIIVTSSMDNEDILKAKSLGIDHYVVKPVTEEKLGEALALGKQLH